MPLNKLNFKSGITSDITPYSNEGGFVDCDKIRFRLGYPEKMGGWVKYTTDTFQGSARRLHNWIALDGSDFLGLGTELKYYIEEGQSFNDITPIRNTTSAGDVTFAATNGSATITVTDPAHGANENDFVTFSGAASLGGNITATVLNAEYKIVSLISSNSYTITATATANSSDTGNGGVESGGDSEVKDSILSIIEQLDQGDGVDFETVLTNAVARGFDRGVAEEKLDELSNEGTLHEPRFGWFRIVG